MYAHLDDALALAIETIALLGWRHQVGSNGYVDALAIETIALLGWRHQVGSNGYVDALAIETIALLVSWFLKASY